jgi:hypothetical protein
MCASLNISFDPQHLQWARSQSTYWPYTKDNWQKDASESEEFMPLKNKHKLEDLPLEKRAELSRVIKHNKPIYEELRQHSIASFNTGVSKHMLIKEVAPKSALLEEFLHGTQNDLNIINKYGLTQELEVHVKDFMLRHVKLLGLDNPNDINLLRQLKVEEITRLRNMQ